MKHSLDKILIFLIGDTFKHHIFPIPNSIIVESGGFFEFRRVGQI